MASRVVDNAITWRQRALQDDLVQAILALSTETANSHSSVEKLQATHRLDPSQLRSGLATALKRGIENRVAEPELVVPGMVCGDYNTELHHASGRVRPLCFRGHQVLLICKTERLGVALYGIATEAVGLGGKVRRPHVIPQCGHIVRTIGVQTMRTVFLSALCADKVAARRVCQVSVALYHSHMRKQQSQEDDPSTAQSFHVQICLILVQAESRTEIA